MGRCAGSVTVEAGPRPAERSGRQVAVGTLTFERAAGAARQGMMTN